ncbi:MAG TPA: DNA repair protein RecN [Acidimicrobiia bacterium]|nr:DNA repair protein RecN [Acidimicrobiia bacterium]
MTGLLRELHVTDLGIVDDLTLLLGPGLTAITGETGAGKTLLVEALDLLLGGRADASLVRQGAAEARVEGRFERADGTEQVLARVLPADGRTRAYVDGRLATVGELAAEGAHLVELHAQHAQQRLFAAATQRAALDRFAGQRATDAHAALHDARAEARAIDADLAALGGDARARARELDLLRFQVDEIDGAGLEDPGEEVALEAEEALLADAAAHREALGVAYRAVEGPALEGLGEAIGALDERAPFRELVERLRAGQAEIAEVERELRLVAEGIPDDPGRLDEVRARRRALRALQRKYGDTLAEVLAFAGTTRQRIVELEGYEERAAELEARRRAADERAADAARSLTEARRGAAGPLAEAVVTHLRELAMPHARLEVAVEPGPLTDDGADAVTFLLAPNPGEPPKPLARAASGGELSRAMLALRLVLTEGPPSLVFDEVDAGIGGEAGSAVGRLLADLADRHQVLCVTHLAQVAAHAQTQVAVEKVEDGGRTVARAAVAEGDARVGELSRMLAGLGESDHARRHAVELLERAAAARAVAS